MNNYYRHNINRHIKLPRTLEAKAIVLDSIGVKDTSLSDSDIIANYIKENIDSYTAYNAALFYNYIIDRNGDIHEIIPIDFAGKCCNFHEYSERIFNKFSFTQDKDNLDREVISIATLSSDSLVENHRDTGNMTSECFKSLYNLIIYLLCRLTNEYGVILNCDSVLIRYYLTYKFDESIGHNLLKRSISLFYTLKRNIAHGMNECRFSKRYKTMFNFVD